MKDFSKYIKVGRGDFVVSPRPRGGDWLETDLQSLKRQGFTMVASLLTKAESEELALSEEARLCQVNGLLFKGFPIVDRSVPANRQAFDGFAFDVLKHLSEGGRGFFHCRAGLGRAPLLGCSVLVKQGWSPSKAWEHLEEVRGQPVPDTAEQKTWIEGETEALSLDDALSKLMDL